jgi:superfamily II DNA or RNA helicase
MGIANWERADSALARDLVDSNNRSLKSWEYKPEWIEEQAHIEEAIAEGGYGHRQVYELVQNGADAMVNRSGGRIEVILTETHLYCANEGNPIDKSGLEALLGSNMSRKRGDEIGRFGLGFKSVLAVSDRPEFFSRPVSLRFSNEYSSRLIHEHIPESRKLPLPILRLGEPLDPNLEAASDPVLEELLKWSVTTVRLARDPDRDTSWLADDLTEFPAEFLLFARHVSELILDNRASGVKRTIVVEPGDEQVRLVEGKRDQAWRVFRRVVAPTPAARKDAGARAERDQLPVDWAVPVTGSSGVGKFWAFFPTTFETTLSGILNAPWKTNPDRENLLLGAFNEFLLEVAAGLVVENLQRVSSFDDPAKHLDRMPARGKEARGWADRQITEQVYLMAAARESLPDQRGQLDFPSRLRIHPERVSAEALELWCSYDFRPHRWVHKSADTRERRPRAERLLEASRDGSGEAESPIATYREWLEALAAPASAEASAAALAVAELLKGQISPMDFDEVRTSRIVRSLSGQLVAPDPNRVFIGGRPDIDDTWQVDPELLEDSFAERALRSTFGVVEVDRSAEFTAYVATKVDSPDYWAGVWDRAAHVSLEQAKEVLGRHFRPGEIQVRALDGEFRALGRVLLAGPVVDASGSDAEFTIDEGWHAETLELVRALGATDLPLQDRGDFDSEPDWYEEYFEYAREQWRQSGRTLRGKTTLESDQRAIPSHLEILQHLIPVTRSRLTAELLRLSSTQTIWGWRQAGGGQDGSVTVESPAVWVLSQHGLLDTTMGLVSTSKAVSAELREFSRLLPVARLSPEATGVLNLPRRIEDCPTSVLVESLEPLAEETDDVLIGRYVSAVASLLPAPDKLPCRVGPNHGRYAPDEITAIANPEVYQQLRTIESPIILAPTSEDADRLVARWRLRPEGDLITTEISYQLCAPEVPLIDEFPGLRLLPAMADHRTQNLMRCTELTRAIRAASGQTSNAIEKAVSDGRIYWLVQDAANPHDDDGNLLAFISAEFGLNLLENQITALLQNKKDEAQRRLTESIRDQSNDVDRILMCLGPEAIRRYVPASLIDAVAEQGHGSDDRMVAEMALAVHGVDILREAKHDLELRGLAPPLNWAGGRAAQEFVRDLGFSREYAGFPEDRLDEVYEAIGPVDLKPLHDFQAVVRDRFRELLRTRGKTKRAMLSLPTGAGKTRVAVQSLVEHFVDDEISGPVLWIAQSEELCEQAVQAWAEVWRAMGPPKTLTIGRLWDANGAEPVSDQPHVVVATIQKLSASVIGNEAYEWLSNTAIVVVDEAHRGATTPTFTALLKWLGLEARGDDRCPLVGLTATPFIGANQTHTEILAKRYGLTRLDTGLFPEDDTEQLISLLQDRRILARAEHTRIDGVDIDLSEGQMAELDKFRRLPRAIETELGLNAVRNAALVDSIQSHDDDWQILVFAPSVENAQTLAALLRLEGIAAAAITAETRPGVRRHYVQQFKDRKIRVLTNYGTLTTGFDAPEVRAVYVARPTYSPNLYLQMIGRGLRGPANGGTEECLIVDVEDNVRMYGGKLAFTDFEFLWTEKTGA